MPKYMLRLDLWRKQMRAVRLIRDESAAVKGCAGADAIRGNGRRGLDHERSAHAVALCSHLACLTDLMLPTKIRNVGLRVRFDRARDVDGPRELVELRAAGGILEIERRNIADDGRFRRPIERIRNEHGVAFGSQALAEIAKDGPQAENIRPDEHTRMLSGRRVDEGGIAGPIRRADVDILLDDLHLRACGGPHDGDDAGRRGQGQKSRRQCRRTVLSLHRLSLFCERSLLRFTMRALILRRHHRVGVRG